MRSQLEYLSLLTWHLAIAAAGEDMPLSNTRPRPSASRRTNYDPDVALRYRLERKVRKAMEYRKRNRLPKVTVAEIVAWADEMHAQPRTTGKTTTKEGE